MDEIERMTILNQDGMLLWTARSYWLVGVLNLVLAVAGPIYFLGYAPQAEPPLPWAPAIGFGAGTCFGGVVGGALHLAAASGLGRGSKWGWYLAMFLSLWFLPTCCFPFGLFFLVALVRGKVRTAFLG